MMALKETILSPDFLLIVGIALYGWWWLNHRDT